MLRGPAPRRWSSRLRDWRPSRSTPITIAAFLGLLCIGATVAIVVLDVTPIVVRSDSMAPEIERGDLVLARSASAGDVEVGDVISVTDRAGVRVTHRVATVDPYGSSIQFTLKGDANTVPDAQVYNETSIDKVVWSAPRLGYPMGVAIGPIGVFVGGLLVAALAWVVSAPWRQI